MANLLKMANVQSILSLTCARLVPAADRPRAGRRPRDGPEVRAAAVVRGKTSQCADRLRGVKTSHFADAPGSGAKTSQPADRRVADGPASKPAIAPTGSAVPGRPGAASASRTVR